MKTSIHWKKKINSAFLEPKKTLLHANGPRVPRFRNAFSVLETDVSIVDIGTVLSQKIDHNFLRPIHNARLTMTIAERNILYMWPRSAGSKILISRFPLFLISTEPFILLTNLQALEAAFVKKEIHTHLARC